LTPEPVCASSRAAAFAARQISATDGRGAEAEAEAGAEAGRAETEAMPPV
jgi:hypothetical protein